MDAITGLTLKLVKFFLVHIKGKRAGHRSYSEDSVFSLDVETSIVHLYKPVLSAWKLDEIFNFSVKMSSMCVLILYFQINCLTLPEFFSTLKYSFICLFVLLFPFASLVLELLSKVSEMFASSFIFSLVSLFLFYLHCHLVNI